MHQVASHSVDWKTVREDFPILGERAHGRPLIYFDNAATGEACAASIAAPAGRNANVTIPSGEVKLNREFDVSSGTPTTMLLDFDGDKSVRETGNGGVEIGAVGLSHPARSTKTTTLQSSSRFMSSSISVD